MPTITDATVVAQAYDTSGNGGRKLVRLDNGNLISIVKNTSTLTAYIYKSLDGIAWSQLCYFSLNQLGDITIQSNGTYLYVICATTNKRIAYFVVNTDTQSNVDISSSYAYVEQTDQTAIGNVSIAINEAKTELHATWASKNSTYPNSFNIRYAKGTINGDGTVTWSAVTQVTKINTTNQHIQNPSIGINKNGYPFITTEFSYSSSFQINFFTTSFTTQDFTTLCDASWGNKAIYSGSTYTQSSPSAIFVPQSINGLANGRIWVAWHGKDATDTTSTNIRVSYSDDLGVTWSAMQKLTSGNAYNQLNTSITANKANEIFILFNGAEASYTSYNIKQIKNSGGTWGSVTRITNSTGDNARYPSCLFDLSVNYSSPLFIYQNMQTAKVGFYGTWTVTIISVTPGDIGQKTDKNNILSYSITTDGEMSTITEKINGTVVNTRNTTSGQAVTLGLTQAQWDAIRFGKYADATGGKNTLTVEMGSEKWTYTFDKQLASDSDIISASKAVKDANEVYLPAQISRLKSVAESKGAVIPSNPKIDDVINGIANLSSGRKASGTVTASGTAENFVLVNGGSYSTYSVTVSGLSFTPSIIILKADNGNGYMYESVYDATLFSDLYPKSVKMAVYNNNSYAPTNVHLKGDVAPAYVNNTSFKIPAQALSKTYSWIAIE